jgi:hypothetical protein
MTVFGPGSRQEATPPIIIGVDTTCHGLLASDAAHAEIVYINDIIIIKDDNN